MKAGDTKPAKAHGMQARPFPCQIPSMWYAYYHNAETRIMFGKFIKELRAQKRLGLREFCLKTGYDPSNWSKIEREVLPPPKDEATLREWAKQLGIKQDTDDWHKFFNYAAVDAGRIPDQLLKDEELVEKLPAFFRTLSGNKPSDEELESLIKLLRER